MGLFGLVLVVFLIFKAKLKLKNITTCIEPPARQDGIVLKRSAEYPFCVVIQVPDNVTEATLALEFRLQKHRHKFITRGAQMALESAWRHLPVSSDISESLFVANEALGFCDKQEIDTHVPACDDNPPFLLHLKKMSTPSENLLYWPTWVPLVGSLGGLVLFHTVA